MTTRYPTREHGVPSVVHAMQLRITYADTGLSKPFPNYLPQDAQILGLWCKIVTAFNGTTPILTVGCNSSSYNDIAAAADIQEATTGADVVFTGVELDTSSAPLLPYAKLAESVASTAGDAILTLLYIPKIDR